MRPLVARSSAPLQGSARVPGDKSISHRALMFGALAVGESRVRGLLEGEDVLRTAAAMRQLGAAVDRREDGSWHVHGVGIGGLCEPADVIDMGNAGTGARLLMGLVASHPITCFVTGDASLRRRPMARVTLPLTEMGARFVAREGGRLPLAVIGATEPLPISYTLPVASAQVKSAVLLAGLNTPGETTVIEPEATRDHTELMLRHFGAELRIEPHGARGRTITLIGEPELTGRDVDVPADPSSAAFPAVAALIVPGSTIRLTNVGVNPLRTGLYETLREMGTDIKFESQRVQAGEPVADLVITAGRLRGIEVPAERAPRMIDEYPILAVCAAFAAGRTLMRGLAELRVKESDRLGAMARGLTAAGIKVEAGEDWLAVEGMNGKAPKGGATVVTNLDHRIAMAFMVLGGATAEPITIDDAEPIDTSFPGFAELMNGLGARLGV
ncbi:MAG: 3-phosphoshikimate 1-carboxyvinyltransferase [Alphaproteobacteria bacterium]|nr:3-phosphoshikimate 1-carboxyvinyltransferase [Alphaproteobacteria bacterium]